MVVALPEYLTEDSPDHQEEVDFATLQRNWKARKGAWEVEPPFLREGAVLVQGVGALPRQEPPRVLVPASQVRQSWEVA